MGEHTFDDVTRRAAEAVSRRASLVSLGMAGLAVFAHPFPTDAKNKNKNKKNRSNKKASKRCEDELAECTAQTTSCSVQAEECTAFLSAACAGDPACPNLIACCLFLDRCHASAFLTCLDNGGI
ncbi:MAG: hypothetical protein ACRDJC_23630 [Thermomicrobiales bacterium]